MDSEGDTGSNFSFNEFDLRGLGVVRKSSQKQLKGKSVEKLQKVIPSRPVTHSPLRLQLSPREKN